MTSKNDQPKQAEDILILTETNRKNHTLSVELSRHNILYATVKNSKGKILDLFTIYYPDLEASIAHIRKKEA